MPLQKGEAKMQLEGKVALVTGGARGLGRSMAMAYAREGADVAIVARTPSELDAVGLEIRALGRRAHTVNAELTTSEDANQAAQETISELGKIDILVNNAGGYRLFTKDLTPLGYGPGHHRRGVAVGDGVEPDHHFHGLQGGPASHDKTSQRRHRQPDFKERGPPGPGRTGGLRSFQGGGGAAERVAGGTK